MATTRRRESNSLDIQRFVSRRRLQWGPGVCPEPLMADTFPPDLGQLLYREEDIALQDAHPIGAGRPARVGSFGVCRELSRTVAAWAGLFV